MYCCRHSARFHMRYATILGVLLILLMPTGHTLASDGIAIASPVSPIATELRLPGKLIWVDLVTVDPRKAATFYNEVFGWTVHAQSSDGYVELGHNGRRICSVVAYDSDVAADVDARWLLSISVNDADSGAATAVRAGAELLEPVADFDNRGRYALISDAQGAVFMLLAARGGDPVDEPVEIGSWGWAELWTDDVDGAVGFYKSVVGYESVEVSGADGERRVILGNDGMARATVVGMPWPDVEPNWVPYVPVADATKTLHRIYAAGGGVLATMPESGEDVRIALAMDSTGGVFAIQQVEESQ